MRCQIFLFSLSLSLFPLIDHPVDNDASSKNMRYARSGRVFDNKHTTYVTTTRRVSARLSFG